MWVQRETKNGVPLATHCEKIKKILGRTIGQLFWVLNPSRKRDAQLTFRSVLRVLSCLFLPSEGSYLSSFQWKWEKYEPPPVFFDSICIGIQEFALFVWIWNLWIFVLVLVAGRSFEKGFLLSVSRVLLRVILFREDISSISCFLFPSEMIHLAYYILWYIIPFCLQYIPLWINKCTFTIFRTLIKPFLYTFCVCEQYVCTCTTLIDADILSLWVRKL